MTTIVYTEEVTTTQSPNSSPRNVQKFTVKIMDGGKGSEGRNGQRAGSPKPEKKFSVRHTRKQLKSKSHSFDVQSHFPSGYNPHMFTITAYLPYDGGRRLKLQCTPGMTVQQVIETEIPDISRTGYQVYQFPSRALLNPEKDASVLQDQEISIEPMRLQSPDEVEDERLGIVKELLRTEDAYLENLRNIFDIYMEPLRKWGLPQADMNTLFRSLSRLCDLLMNFFSELELAVQYWNTTSTQIGGLFKQYASFWEMYEEYAQSYAKACKLLKGKRMMDESFNRFLEMKRGAAMHTLESLMLLPVQRIYNYHRLLVQLYSITPKDHLDYHDLRFTVACVSKMVQARERQLNQFQNETKLEQVQLRFSTDSLHLSHGLDVMEASPRRSNKNAGNPALPRTPSHLKKHSTGVDFPDGLEMERRSARVYLQEGPVKIITGLQPRERFLFLFDDLLLIAKPTGKQRSQHRSYKLKHRLRLSEMWVTDCMDEVLGATLPPDTCFVIGWPIINCVAAFSSPGEKNLWHGLLSKHINNQRQAVQPDSVSVRIVNLTKSSNNLPLWMQVHSSEKARDVLSRALDQFAIAVSESNCQIWVKFSKEEPPAPLIGHESPFSIQMHHNRHQMDIAGDAKPSQLQFIIKRKSAIATDTPSVPQQPRLRKPFKTPSFMAWYKGRRHGREAVSSRQKNKLRLFAAPLDTVIINEQLPEILQEMLIRLYTEGPTTLGIFRQSANHRKVKEIREAINNREQVDLSDISIHVVGALLKEILRNVPGGILVSSRYTEFVATNDIKDVTLRVQHIQRILTRLPIENQIFLQYLMPLLHYISTREEINCMNSINLAICFAPSILWPDSGLDVIKNEVPPLVQFMVEHTPKIFGSELPELYKQAKLPTSAVVESMEYTLDPQKHYVPTKVEDGSHKYFHQRTSSMDTASTSDESAAEDEPVSNLRKAHNSGLTVSDSQLSQISQYEDYEYHGRTGAVELSGKHILSRQAKSTASAVTQAFPTPKRIKRSRPERSHSYRGPNERSPQQRHKYSGGVMVTNGRRKSLASHTQPRQKLLIHHPEFLPSSNSSPASVHAFSSVREESLDEDSEDTLYQGQGKLLHKRPSLKRKAPQHSHSFSKSSENKPPKPALPTSVSTSFYDKLLPLNHEARARSRSLNAANIAAIRNGLQTTEEDEPVANMTWPADQMPSSIMSSQMPSPAVGSGVVPPHPHASSQSITSSRSASSTGSQTRMQQLPPYYAQKRPSNLSLTSSGYSGGSGEIFATGSPDMLAELEQTPLHKLDREFIKVAISKRFGISSTDWPKSTPQEIHGPFGHVSSFTTSTPYGYGNHESEHTTPVKDGKTEPHDEVSIDTIQKKLQERKRLDTRTSESAFSKSKSYRGFSAAKKNGHNMDTLNFDDRPEADQHQNSLPRPPMAEFTKPQQYLQPEMVLVPSFAEEHDPTRLYPGYNSDTESSPSRTLSRPEKLKEVTSPGITSPTKSSVPHRYRTPGTYPYYTPYSTADARKFQSYEKSKRIQNGAGKSQSQTEKQATLTAEPRSTFTTGPKTAPTTTESPSAEPKSTSSADSKNTSSVESQQPPKSLEAQPQLSERREASQPMQKEERAASILKQLSSSKASSVDQKKTERNEQVKSERSPKTTSKYSDPLKRKEMFAKERTLSNVEDAKMKLGLLPPRQRSKSTSESEAMRIIHKVLEEEEEQQSSPGMTSAADEERAEKHKEWLSYAPTSTERKKAWEHLSKSIPKLQTRDVRSRSLKQGSPVLPRKNVLLQQSSPKSEQLQRKSSTMPEYLAAGRNGNRRLGTGLVRTVKVTAYEIPEPQRIRRINLRTYH